MTGSSLKLASFTLVVCACLSGLVSPAIAQRGGVRKPVKKQQKQNKPLPALPAYTPAPLQPLPLEQVPTVAPRVHFADGELSIVAHNSTLSDVLKEVREQTGAELDMPPSTNERVVADLGPGPAREVLADLLNGTHFNYVMVGSRTDPNAIQSIVLTPRTGGPDTTPSASNNLGLAQRGFVQPVTNISPTDVAVENDGAEDADGSEDQAADQPDQNQNPAQQTPKTPEQLLQELQRQQQQLQQQQNQTGQPGQAGQNPTPPGILPNQPPTGAAPTPTKPD